MTRHFSEAELLETYYMQPGESMPVMMHLAECATCAAKYDRLERKLREAATCHTDHPETFWARQRHAIMHRVHEERTASAPWRVAAAALLALVIGGAAMYRHSERPAPAALQPVVEEAVPADPWESDQLKEYQSVVEWESWVAESEGRS